MSNHEWLTEEVLTTVLAMWGAGCTTQEIANRYEICSWTVSESMKKLRHSGNQEAINAHAARTERRGLGRGRGLRYTDRDDAVVAEMWMNGETAEDIGKRIGRSEASIYKRISNLIRDGDESMCNANHCRQNKTPEAESKEIALLCAPWGEATVRGRIYFWDMGWM